MSEDVSGMLLRSLRRDRGRAQCKDLQGTQGHTLLIREFSDAPVTHSTSLRELSGVGGKER